MNPFTFVHLHGHCHLSSGHSTVPYLFFFLSPTILYTAAKVSFSNGNSDLISLYNTLQQLPVAFRIEPKRSTTAYMSYVPVHQSNFLSIPCFWGCVHLSSVPSTLQTLSPLPGLCGHCSLSFLTQRFLWPTPPHLQACT